MQQLMNGSILVQKLYVKGCLFPVGAERWGALLNKDVLD